MSVLRDVIAAALRAKQDPMTVLAMGIQESRLGNALRPDDVNILRLLKSNTPTWLQDLANAQPSPDPRQIQDQFLAESLRHFADRVRTVGQSASEALRLQAYNGLGWVRPSYTPQRTFYGSSQPLHGRRDQPYGKRVIAIREAMLRPSQALANLIRSVTRQPHTAMVEDPRLATSVVQQALTAPRPSASSR